MQRPIMNPTFLDVPAPKPPRKGLLRRIKGLFSFIGRILLADVRFWHPGSKLRVEDAGAFSRIFHGMVYRLLFIPLGMAAVVAVLVYMGTHPAVVNSSIDPQSIGIYYDPVSFASADGTRLEAWLVPAIDARVVIEQQEKVLQQERAAVVLVHGYGADRLQMLPLVKPLHEAGYIVLVTTLRGEAGDSSACTFGVRESEDVLAAIEVLRRRADVDPKRIALIGTDTGATACLLAAEKDGDIQALIMDRPVRESEKLIESYLRPPQPWLIGLSPICKWTFEMAYKVDIEDLDLNERVRRVSPSTVLVFEDRNGARSCYHDDGLRMTQQFLADRFSDEAIQTAANEIDEIE